MLYILNRESWLAEIKLTRRMLLNEQEVIVDALAKVYACEPVYFIFKRKDKIIISFIAFTKGQRLFQPIHFFYSAFWVDSGLSDRVYAASLFEFIEELKKRYKNIHITLPIEIKDIRPFLWQGFSVENRYTYLKQTNELSYGKYMERKLGKAEELPLKFVEEKIDAAAIDLNLGLLKKLSFSKTSLKDIKELLKSLSSTTYLVSFNVYLDEKLLISDILLKDEEHHLIYEILKNSLKGEDNIQSIAYHRLFQYYAKEGFSVIDLMGADMQSISKFKAGFNPTLTPHFVVKYSWVKNATSKLKTSAKTIVKGLIR
ncbi:hypothetical protein [Pedobacter xixiisoli]|uniref:Acetyltransferase (GNAT) domain-containing protein n=1 Tax=Pedobacter xixiisoli TaxID=1476464 RepID=A0A285ZPY8_9SPHI|nr:hypothetical protein [Pedobacter xixiisoli]SOD11700.1 hypothetical protein SAMN06297358_0288 [Pedobacter xixiisoli]